MGAGWRAVVALSVLALLVSVPAAGRADEPARPWAEGVSAEEQARAKELFAAGNVLLDQGLFAPALEAFRQAITHWDHPGIRYNIAVALINLQQPLEAHDNLERALRFGADALDPGLYGQGLAYKRLLDAQIARLTVECAEPDARVSLDGRDLLRRCPGTTTELVLAGAHRLLAEKPGYVARTIDLALSGGEERRVSSDLMRLMRLEDATVVRRPWAWWKPWLVVGAGVAVGAAGLGFELQSRATLRSYDDAVAILCADHPCGDPPAVVTDAYDRARLENRVAIGLFVAGGATLATGLVLQTLNRPVTERIGYPVTPIVGPGEAGVALALPF